jgi:signal transduction histidine kinase/ActR/RegA family two-component response regulator
MTRRPFLVFTSAVLLIAASLAVALYGEYQNRAQAVQAAGVEARVLASTVTAALSFDDRAALKEYVAALNANADVDAVGVYDAGGRLVAGFTRTRLASDLSKTMSTATAPGRIIVKAPVMQEGQLLGTVYLRDRTEPLMRTMSRYIGPGLLVLMASLMFMVMTLDAQALRRANRVLATHIAEREKAEAALRQSQKMEAVGRLTGGIAHDFNNMLAIILGSLDLLFRRYPQADPKLLHLAHEATEAAKRASALTQRLLAFSRLQPLKPISVDINKTVNDMTALLRRTLGETIAVETVLAAGLWRAHIDLSQLEITIANLAINARDAMPDGGKLTIETGNAYLDRAYADSTHDVTPGQYVLVAITDTGSGIPADILNQVIEPFFTTKPAGQGTGLGLSQVHGFVKQTGGHLRIYSEVGRGTTVKLYLPRSLTESEKLTPTAVRAQASVRRGLTVLVVEDEAGVREFAVEALIELGYDVLAAERAAVALEVLDAHPEISVLLTDVVMPEIGGRVLADEALRRRPALRVLFMTGYTPNAIVHNGVLDPGTHLVSKPFTVAQLGAELASLLNSPSPSARPEADAPPPAAARAPKGLRQAVLRKPRPKRPPMPR